MAQLPRSGLVHVCGERSRQLRELKHPYESVEKAN